jgi:hypothetical protein
MRWQAMALSIASIRAAQSSCRAASIFGANAGKSCLAPFDIHLAGSMLFSAGWCGLIYVDDH